MDLAAQEGAGSEDDGTGDAMPARTVNDANAAAALSQQLGDLTFLHVEARLLVQKPTHCLRIEPAIGLSARSTDRRPLAPVQHPELDPALVDRAPHDTVEGIDLAH